MLKGWDSLGESGDNENGLLALMSHPYAYYHITMQQCRKGPNNYARYTFLTHRPQCWSAGTSGTLFLLC